MAGNDLVLYQGDKPPELVDGRGRPLRTAREILTSDIGGPTLAGMRSVMSGHPADGLTPQRLAQILRGAENGDATAYYELAEQMEERDLHYQSVMGTRKRAVTQLPIEVEAASDSDEHEGDAQIVRDWLKRLTLQSELFDIMDANGKGRSHTEIIWGFGNALWLPERLELRDPRFFEYDQETGQQSLLKGGIDGTSGLPTQLPPWKFIVHTASAKSGLPVRGGIARTAAWFYLFKNYTIKDWITFLEVYGLPLRVGKYGNGTSESDINKLAAAVAQIGSDAGCVIPASMQMEFITSQGGATNPDMFHKLVTYVDDALSKAVLGQTSSSDAKAGGLGSGQADLHGEVRHDIESADAVALSATLTRDLVVPMVMFNRGVRDQYPILRIGRPEKEDVDQKLKLIDAAVRLNVPVGVSQLRKLGLPAPDEGEELITAPAATAPASGPDGGDGPSGAARPPRALLGPSFGQSGAIRRPGRDAVAAAAEVDAESARRAADAIDTVVIDAIGQMDGLADDLMTGFEELIAAANSMEEVQELMAIHAGDMVARMDIAAFAQVMERTTFAARIAGLISKPGQ